MCPIANNDSIPSYHHWIIYPWWLLLGNRDQFCCWFCRVDGLIYDLYVCVFVWFDDVFGDCHGYYWCAIARGREWGEWVKCDWRLASIQDIISNSDIASSSGRSWLKKSWHREREHYWCLCGQAKPLPLHQFFTTCPAQRRSCLLTLDGRVCRGDKGRGWGTERS